MCFVLMLIKYVKTDPKKSKQNCRQNRILQLVKLGKITYYYPFDVEVIFVLTPIEVLLACYRFAY
jgi:hypothetical protein